MSIARIIGDTCLGAAAPSTACRCGIPAEGVSNNISAAASWVLTVTVNCGAAIVAPGERGVGVGSRMGVAVGGRVAVGVIVTVGVGSGVSVGSGSSVAVGSGVASGVAVGSMGVAVGGGGAGCI